MLLLENGKQVSLSEIWHDSEVGVVNDKPVCTAVGLGELCLPGKTTIVQPAAQIVPNLAWIVTDSAAVFPSTETFGTVFSDFRHGICTL